jgi:hypothetical protein
MARIVMGILSGAVLGTRLGSVIGVASLATTFVATTVRAQNTDIETLKAKISAAQMAQRDFAKGLSHCGELNGTNFYFATHDRVFDLAEYHRSLNSLALQGNFNPETRKPWTQADADARWAEAQALALKDKTNCDLAASLPGLQNKLQALQQTAASQTDPSASKK